MGLSQKLSMRQGQSLVMTPQLTQSIKLLAMSNVELNAFVESEVEKNPLLEISSESPHERETHAAVATSESGEPISLSLGEELDTSAAQLAENLGTSVENTFPDEPDYTPDPSAGLMETARNDVATAPNGLQMSSGISSSDASIADYTAQEETLHDHLLHQLALSAASAPVALIVRDLISQLDNAGYLQIDMEELCARLGATDAVARQAVALLQSFEPVGIGARNLAECLRLQLADRDRLDPAIDCLLDNLNLLAKRDFVTLKSRTGLDVEDLHDALVEIQALDPKPGHAFAGSNSQYVVADVLVSQTPDLGWRIELNSETLPKVLINNTYVSQLSTKLTGSDDKTFLHECTQSANWLTKSLDQRAQTILKVAREIVKQQDAFLVHGVQKLRPLTLKAVADAIEMHESSVSRVTSNKYMMTPRGIFELKYFFTTSIASTDKGDGHSAEAVRDRIKSLIDAESPGAILSDDAIVEALKTSGIDIARRTIAKYREAMNIPSSVQRRREKRTAQHLSSSRQPA